MIAPEICAEMLGANIVKLTALKGERRISQAEFLDALDGLEPFRTEFNSVLAGQAFGSFFWEMPLLSAEKLGGDFETVLVESAGLARREPDERCFAGYFEAPEQEVVVIDNLGGDARLVIPAARAETQIYTDIASFARNAPKTQRDALWQATARAVKESLAQQDVWLSTSGWGVAWLHIQLDQRPKYYTHAPYRDGVV